MKKITLTIVSLILAGCVNTELSTGNSYDPDTQSRIRLYGQNGRPTIMNVEVNGKQEEINVGGSLGQSFSSLFGLKGSESLGIPQTEYSKDPSVFSNIGSRAFFKEFVIPAGKVVKVRNSIDTPPHFSTNVATGKTTVSYRTCKGNEIEFVPEAGKDYEVVPSLSTAECGVNVNEIK